MSKISVLRSGFEGTHWKRTFATCLTLLVPDMNPDAADEVSDAEFPRSKDSDPEVAARRWVERQQPRDLSTPSANAG